MQANIKRCILLLILTYYTNNGLNYINFNYDKILKVIQSLDPNRAHGHDDVSVRMLKISSPSIIKPLLIIFCNCLKFGTFANDWRKSNLVPVYQKDNEQNVNNYGHAFLLPLCSKAFAKLVFVATFEYMVEKNILSRTRSGLEPNDSCINQLISITHSIFSAFYASPLLEVLFVFLGLSQVFDHRTIIQTEITYKKIACYMHESA